MKIHPVGAVLFQADTQTDRQGKKQSFFQNFVKNGPKITVIQLNNRRVTLILAVTNLVTVMFL